MLKVCIMIPQEFDLVTPQHHLQEQPNSKLGLYQAGFKYNGDVKMLCEICSKLLKHH